MSDGKDGLLLLGAFGRQMGEMANQAFALQQEARSLMAYVGGLPNEDTWPEVNAQMMLAIRELEVAEFRLRRAWEFAMVPIDVE